jgi:hypothetical protein
MQMGMVNDLPISALGQLMLGYVTRDQRPLHRLCWALDARLAGVFRSVREPAIADIRFAWWRDALARNDQSKGRGDPLIDAWRSFGLAHTHRAYVEELVDGWAQLVGQDGFDALVLSQFAEARGGGLFGLMAGLDVPPTANPLRAVGAQWALWDLAGHIGQDGAAEACLAAAAAYEPLPLPQRADMPKALRLMVRLARSDVRRDRVPLRGFALRHYLHVLVAAPFV